MARADTTPADFAKAMKEGELAMTRSRPQQAIAAFEKAVQLDPKSGAAHVALADALMKSVAPASVLPADQEKLKRAEQHEQAALEISPKNAEALAGLGELQYRLGLPTGNPGLQQSSTISTAKETLLKAVAADPKNYHAHVELARIASAEFFGKLLAAMGDEGLKPGQKQEFTTAFKERLWKEGGPILDEGVQHATKAISVRENPYEAMHELSSLYYIRSNMASSPAAAQVDIKTSADWQRKADSAFARQQRTVALGPQAPAVDYKNFGEAMAAGKKSTAAYQYEAAIHAYRKAVQLDAKSAEAHVELGNALIRTAVGSSGSYPYDPERLQQGIKEEQRALTLAPKNAEAMAAIGTATYAYMSHQPPGGDRFADGKDWAKRALAEDPKNYQANFLMAKMADQETGSALFEASGAAYKRGVRDGTLPADLREPLAKKHGPLLDDGIKNAQAALAARPESYLAMWELSNLYFLRQRLGLESANADMQTANEWRKKAFDATPKEDAEAETIRNAQRISTAGVVGGAGTGAKPASIPDTAATEPQP